MAAVSSHKNGIKLSPSAASVIQVINKSFPGCKVESVGGTEHVIPVVIGGITRVGLETIESIVGAAPPGVVEDIRVWGIGYAPNNTTPMFGLNVHHPLTLEVVIRKSDPSIVEFIQITSTIAKTDDTIVIRESALSMIKDSAIRRIVCMFINCMAMGDQPDKYQLDLGAVTYHEDKKENLHMVMFDRVPTIGLSFMRNIRRLFPSIRDIVFERRESMGASNVDDMTKSATVMIATFQLTPVCNGGGMLRTRPNVRQKTNNNPY